MREGGVEVKNVLNSHTSPPYVIWVVTGLVMSSPGLFNVCSKGPGRKHFKLYGYLVTIIRLTGLAS